MITRLVTGILAVTSIPLGIVFSIAFGALGLPFLAVGLLFAAAFGILTRRARAAGERRTARTRARVVRQSCTPASGSASC